MEFHKHDPLWTLLKKAQIRDVFANKIDFFEHYIKSADLCGDAFSFRRGIMERDWDKLGHPYYNVYPAILPMLLSLRLDISCSTLQSITIQPIEVRLPLKLDVPGLCWQHGRIKSLLMGIQPVPKAENADELVDGLVIAFDIGELDAIGHPILAFKFFPLRDDMTIEEASNLLPAHESLGTGVQIPHETMLAAVRLCACIALIDSDSDIITPDILNRDKDKWDSASEAKREEMTKRARSRGKLGWDIGASVEYAPHYRRPHPALVRVGKGRTLSRIVMRKGSVVHRGKLTSIPSGFSVEDDNIES